MRILAYLSKMGHPAVGDNMLSLVNALSKIGHTVRLCDVNNNEELRGVLLEISRDSNYYDLSVGFNNLGLEWDIAGYSDTVYIYEVLDFTHVSIMLDEPFNRCVSGYDLPCKNHIVTYLDRSDLGILDYMYPDKKMKKIFFPLGGTLKEDIPEPWATEKEYDIVVSAGTWGEMEPRWQQDGISRSVASVLDDAADILMNCPVNMMTAFQEALYMRGLYDKEYLKKFIPYFWTVMEYIKPWRRHQMVKCLIEANFEVHVFGDGWQNVSFSDKLIKHGVVPYREMLDVISKTKVLVQDEAMFNDGAHDRVFTGMLNGAVVFSEYSSYLDELFENQKDLFMFDWKQTKEQMEAIHQLLDDDNYRAEIAERAYNKVIKTQTWDNRAQRIIEAVEISQM